MKLVFMRRAESYFYPSTYHFLTHCQGVNSCWSPYLFEVNKFCIPSKYNEGESALRSIPTWLVLLMYPLDKVKRFAILNNYTELAHAINLFQEGLLDDNQT